MKKIQITLSDNIENINSASEIFLNSSISSLRTNKRNVFYINEWDLEAFKEEANFNNIDIIDIEKVEFEWNSSCHYLIGVQNENFKPIIFSVMRLQYKNDFNYFFQESERIIDSDRYELIYDIYINKMGSESFFEFIEADGSNSSLHSVDNEDEDSFLENY